MVPTVANDDAEVIEFWAAVETVPASVAPVTAPSLVMAPLACMTPAVEIVAPVSP